MRRLLRPGFATAVGAGRLADLERYVRAADRRLERAPQGVAGDLDRMRAIHELEEEYRARRERGPRSAAIAEVPRLLEELRVSQFAQGLGTRTPVSAKRIRKLLG
jgi:ATP-dependent helicase HrpA